MEWKEPVEAGEVVVNQYDTFAIEWDVQVRPENSTAWRTVRHCGIPGEKLPKTVVANFPKLKITALRIGNITNGPSFNEVLVYDRPFADGLATTVASDLRGHIIGIVSDASGAAPVAGARVTLSGSTKNGPWQTSAKSDAKGIFSAGMPLGLAGKVDIRTEYKTPQLDAGPAVESRVDAAALAYRLTPRSARHNAVNLDGKWKFSLDPPENFFKNDFDAAAWPEIKVPAHWEMEGFHGDNYVGGYRLRFAAPSVSGRVKLAFEGVYSGAEVWVNGQLVALHEGVTPFEADITDAIRKNGENLLALRVKEHTTTSDDLDHMSSYADFPLAGIMRPVYLFTTPDVHLTGLEVATTFDKNYRDAAMTVRGCVANESSRPYRGNLELSLSGPLPGEETIAKAQPTAVEVGPWQSKDVEIALHVAVPRHWDAEHPNLYALSTRLVADRAETDGFATRVGFRQTEIRGTEIFINGKPVKFRGTCHHDSHPLMGRAVTAELERQDLMLMREANLNAVRTSHYPPLPELPDIADELGVYVEDEASFCWAGGETNDLRNTPRIIQLTAELLARDRNHPSVAYWSLCNESIFGYGFQRSMDWAKAADPSRPAGAATSAALELVTWHNPISLPLMREAEKLDRPLLWDESHAVFQGIWNDVAELWVDPGLRDYYVEPLLTIQDRVMKSKVVQGTFIWCWGDDIFCVPGRGFEYGREGVRCHFVEDSYRLRGRGLVGDAPWGVVDGWRRQKPEFWITKKLHSPVRVKENPLALPPAGEPLRVPVENRYDFSNLSELAIHWTLGDKQGEIRTDVPPRSAGTLDIQPGRTVKEGEVLALDFKDRGGQLIDAYRVPLGREASHAPPGEKCAPAELKILHEVYLEGNLTTIAGRDFNLAFADGNGALMRGVGKGEALLLELPMLHVLPTASALRPLPERNSWRLENFAVKKEGANVLVTLKGRFKNFHGGYELTVTPAGEMKVASSFEYTGDDFRAREIGLRFSVPRDCDTLDWDRRAEWNVYPADHIGRPRGTARAFPKFTNVVPPTCPWSADVSPLGSNDFRSTKRNINWAAIHYADGPGVIVESNGRQHVRAIAESDRISVHVNDWYGGTNNRIEWTANYDTGRVVHKGDKLASTLQLRICPRFSPTK